MSFDEIFDLTAGVYFNFYNNSIVGRRNGCDASRRGTRSIFPIKVKARTVGGRGGGILLSDPGSELRLGRQKEKEKVR